MKTSPVDLQVLYEIAMSIGNSMDLQKMLQESLNTYLRKFNFAAGAVLQAKRVDNAIQLKPVFSIPRVIAKNEAFQKAMSIIPEMTPIDRLADYLRQLPHVDRHGDMHYHVMLLKDFGLLILLKSRKPLSDYMIKTLLPLNDKLASACRACLRNDHIQHIASKLKIENTERLKAETALKEAHERLLTILNSMDVLVYVADLETCEMIFVNQAMAHLFGFDAVGRQCFEVLYMESRPCANCSNEALRASKDGNGGVVVWEDLNPVTRRWYIHHARAIKWIDGRWVRLQISTDITDLKKMEQERIKDARLQQTRRLDALGNLAGGIAHEFNNLLMAMLGNLSLVKINLDESHPFERNLSRIEESIRLAAGLTDKLLGYARKGRYEDVRLQLNNLIRSISASFSESHDAIEIQLDLSGSLHHIEADRRQIEHVLLNLFSNAADAMPDGGSLMIRTDNIRGRDMKDKAFQLPDRDYIELRFKDTGKGMTPETRERIFDPFFTTKPMAVGKGVGLGMAATYGIVKAHHGFIDVISDPARGTEFVIYFPSVADAGE